MLEKVSNLVEKHQVYSEPLKGKKKRERDLHLILMIDQEVNGPSFKAWNSNEGNTIS